jgi:hypothetical protein
VRMSGSVFCMRRSQAQRLVDAQLLKVVERAGTSFYHRREGTYS